MEPDDYQRAWKADAAQVHVAIDEQGLAQEVERAQRELRSRVLGRDATEIGTALLLIPVWFVMGISLALPWTWYLTVPAFIWVAGFLLFDRKRHPQRPSPPGEPLLYYIKESLVQVEHQIWLLRNVFWWYLLPFVLSIGAFFLQVAWKSSHVWWQGLLSASFPSLIVALVYGWIYRLNQRGVREQLEPRRQGLLKLLAKFEGDAASEAPLGADDFQFALDNLGKPGGTGCGGGAWAANWNRLIPSWTVAAAILVPTLAAAAGAAYFAVRYPIPQLGPVLFQSVVAAVLVFELSLLIVWRRARKLPPQSPAPSPPAGATALSPLVSHETESQQSPPSASLPGKPAMLVIFMTILISIMAIVALVAFTRQ